MTPISIKSTYIFIARPFASLTPQKVKLAARRLNNRLLEGVRGAPYVDFMSEPWTGERVRRGWTRALTTLRGFIPQRFRRDRPVVPVVRLTGVIGFSTPLRPGFSIAGIGAHARSGLRSAQRRRSRARHQFAGRIAGAIAPDLPPHPRSGEEKKIAA